MGLDYWADHYAGWVEGQFDWQAMQHCLDMPEENQQSLAGMLGWVHSYEVTHLDEARVLVIGDGAVGKTSLLRRIIHGSFDKEQQTTPGVEVSQHQQAVVDSQGNSRNITVHYWDFGGQLHLHPTHQLFMREKCIYVLVLKAREASDHYHHVEYWLEHVRLFGGNAPTLLVQNQVDCLPSGMATQPPFDIRALHEKYPFIVKQCFNLSCATGEGLEPVQAAIHSQLSQHRILDAQTPTAYYRLKELFYQQRQTTIDKKTYHQLCCQAGLEPDQIQGAVDTLDALGIALHFAKLQSLGDDWYVLDPDWLTKVVYHLLWGSQGQPWEGFLTPEYLQEMFARHKFPDAPEISTRDLPHFLPLLDGFDMAFALDDGSYFVPMLAGVESLDVAPDTKPVSTLDFIIPEGALPPALFHRFVVLCARAKETRPSQIWRTGCDLDHGRAQARVVYEGYNKRLSFSFYGDALVCGEYSYKLRNRLRELIGSDYSKLQGSAQMELAAPAIGTVNFLSALATLVQGQELIANNKADMVALAEVVAIAYGYEPDTAKMREEIAFLRGRNEGLELAVRHEKSITLNANITIHLELQQHLPELHNALDVLAYEVGELGEEHQKTRKDLVYVIEKIKELQQLPAEQQKHTAKGVVATAKGYIDKANTALNGIESIAGLVQRANNAWQQVEPLLNGLG